ncbi:MAG TPA: hypothetical protein VF698_00445 [Thermoanaerobaculia bacterium]|jgi:hypothetical protein
MTSKRFSTAIAHGFTRSLIASLLVLLTVASAAAPHRHRLPQPPASAEAHLAASLSNAGELSRTASGHEDPCAACARQHGFGLAPLVRLAGAPRTHAMPLTPAPRVAERTGQGPNVWLRGPPASTSSC